MSEIFSINILQLHPVRQRTWAVYACDSANKDDRKFYADELECWALVEHIRECERYEAPDLYVGETPCSRETVVRGLHLNELNEYHGDPDNLLGHTQTEPTTEIQKWNGEAEEYYAKRAAEAAAERKRAEKRKKHFAVYAPAPWDIKGEIPNPPYSVVDHGPNDISKYDAGDYWDSPNDPAPTRRERERHGNFLGWALEPADKWSPEERQVWHEKARTHCQGVIDKHKAWAAAKGAEVKV
jgi:hypothetical protein